MASRQKITGVKETIMLRKGQMWVFCGRGSHLQTLEYHSNRTRNYLGRGYLNSRPRKMLEIEIFWFEMKPDRQAIYALIRVIILAATDLIIPTVKS